ncbi:hypothetical protein O181_014523 [Austropuccinia psidii MF-1]|uniref:Uncharacterized protein n=1 Tax=Austropuccinia psidii MF-1 TaxID=1389203 RepID=A0A9Q3C1E3_9BASI|nr:hypothetical protein [Austropuccinia psidii MF-1]
MLIQKETSNITTNVDIAVSPWLYWEIIFPAGPSTDQDAADDSMHGRQRLNAQLTLLLTIISPHSGTELAWAFWESLADRGIIKHIYSIAKNNAVENREMVLSLQSKYEGLNMQWDQKNFFLRCACHVLDLFAKDFLLYMGEPSDNNYQFFSDYLAVDKVPIEDSYTNSTPTIINDQGSYLPLVIAEEVPDD